MPFIRYWLPVVIWAALIFYLSGLPSVKLATSLWNTLAHYVAHFLIYFVFALLLAWAFRGEGFSPRKIFWSSFVIAALYALSDEYHQLFVAGRFADWKDTATDWIGSGVGLIVFLKRKS